MAFIQNDSVGNGGGFMGGGLTPVIDIGNIWGGGRRRGDDCDGNSRALDLAVGAIDGKADGLKDLAQMLGCSVEKLQCAIQRVGENLGDVKTHVSDRVHAVEQNLECYIGRIKDALCDMRHENEKNHGDTRLEIERTENRILKDAADREARHTAAKLAKAELKLSQCEQNEFFRTLLHRMDRQDERIGTIVNGVGNLVGNNTNTGVQTRP